MTESSALEVIRSWLGTGGILALLGVVIKLYLDNRKLRLAEKTREDDFQLKVSADGRSNLQFVIDNLVRDITAQREAHARCEEELDRIRETSRTQEDALSGLARQFAQFSTDVGRAIPPEHRTPVLESILKQHDELDRRDGHGSPSA